jgi:hypothetical protein
MHTSADPRTLAPRRALLGACAVAGLLAGLLLAGAAVARADDEDAGFDRTLPVPRLAIAGPVRGGDVVEIRWDDAGREVDELEVLLSVDDGRHFPLRVSPELHGRETRFLWRVPNLAAHQARLRIRAHLRGREVESAPGEAFELLVEPSRPADLVQSHEGSWWEGLEAPLAGPAAWGDGAPSLARLTHDEAAAVPRRTVAFVTPRLTSERAGSIPRNAGGADLPTQPIATVFRSRRE